MTKDSRNIYFHRKATRVLYHIPSPLIYINKLPKLLSVKFLKRDGHALVNILLAFYHSASDSNSVKFATVGRK